MDIIVWGWAIAAFVYAVICGGLSADLADKKGYSVGAYFAIGFFFGVLGLIAAAGLPSSRLQQERDSHELRSQDTKTLVQEASRTRERKRTTTVADLLDG